MDLKDLQSPVIDKEKLKISILGIAYTLAATKHMKKLKEKSELADIKSRDKGGIMEGAL